MSGATGIETKHSEKRVVILGAGFAGFETAKRLRRLLPMEWDIGICSSENHFVMTPMLPEVVGSALTPSLAIRPVREILRGVACLTVPIVSVDFDAREVTGRKRNGTLDQLGFDHLVIAVGMDVKLDIVPGMAEHGWPVKTLGDAVFLRNHVIGCIEAAQVERDPVERARHLSFAVVGGGFTGVEVAGAISTLLAASTKYYRNIARSDCRVTIVDGNPRVLRPLQEKLSEHAQAHLTRHGIDLKLEARVERVSGEGVHLIGGELVPASTVVSAVGNAPRTLVQEMSLPLERGRITVNPDMSVPGHANVWALGDCAAVPNAHDDTTCPMLAQHAHQQARCAAENIAASIAGRATKPFTYRELGTFALLGHRDAVGQIGNFRLTGWPAYLGWHYIYWSKMPSLGRKIQIALDWFVGLFLPRSLVEIPLDSTTHRGAK